MRDHGKECFWCKSNDTEGIIWDKENKHFEFWHCNSCGYGFTVVRSV